MTPLREWLKPPRTLLLILFLLTLISVSALSWFGWKVLDQERMVEAQRLQQKLEQSADRIAATLRGTLAETGERLGARAIAPPDDGLLLTIEENRVTATPAGRLLYYPVTTPEPEARPDIFADAETAEFQQGRPSDALETYRRLGDSPDATVRAGALLREARVFRRLGEPSRAAYEHLAALSGATVAGGPADLVAHLALVDGRGAAEHLRNDLLAGHWSLTRGQFKFYWSEAGRLSGNSEAPPATALALSEAAEIAWQERRRDPDTLRQETVWVRNQPFLFLWRGRPERREVLVTPPETLLRPVLAGGGVFCAAADADGHIVAGRKAGGPSAHGPTAIRAAAETQLPWTLYLTADEALGQSGEIAQQRFLLLGIAVMVLFLVLGTYIFARAIRREIEVLRMQSDFVAAVSHEFRSPLTSLRQLSEILLLGRAPGEERRQLYYEMLVRETSRLQRLVEGLLNFGRMEAGARPYRFEELDAAALVRRVAAEFDQQMSGAGRHIEIQGSPDACPIEADPEAISVALRNLVDNAIKYSPGRPTVWLEWGLENECVAIRVRDQGLGISQSERKAIFRRFVRGSAATAGNVKGSGLGLAMVRHIVTAHRGEIVVASQPGQGSTFTMLLPSLGRI